MELVAAQAAERGVELEAGPALAVDLARAAEVVGPVRARVDREAEAAPEVQVAAALVAQVVVSVEAAVVRAQAAEARE